MPSIYPKILYDYLILFKFHFNKPSFVYFCGYILSLLLTNGRKTMSRVSGSCFWVDRHLSSWERFLSENRWDVTEVMQTVVTILRDKLKDKLLVHGAYLAVVDTFLIAKNGKRMAGIQKWHDGSGNADRGESIHGHHWAILGLISYSAKWGRYLCFPLLLRLISGQLNPSLFIVDPDGVATIATFWNSIHPLIIQMHIFLQHAPLRVVADAYFSKASFINPLLELDNPIHTITRLAKNRVGWDDPTDDQRSDAKRGKKWKLSNLLELLPIETLTVHLYGKMVQVRATSRVLWLSKVKQKVKVVVIEGVKNPIILMSTDLTLSAAQIIEIYGARFTVELAIRDNKEYFGMGNYQCYLGPAIYRFVHLACVAFCLFRLILLDENNEQWLPQPEKSLAPLSFARVRKAFQRHVIGRILSSDFKPGANLEGSQPELDAILAIVE